MSIAALGMATAIAAALALYAASPQQRLMRRHLPSAALGWGGLGGLAASLVILLQWAGPATAAFIVLTLATLVWTFLPPIAAWLRRPKGDSK